MRRPLGSSRPPLALACAAALWLAACGGDGDETETEAAVSPEAVLECVEAAGLNASLQPVEAGTENDPTVYLNVDLGKTGISVAFFEEPAAAQAFVETQNEVAASGLNPNDTELASPTRALTVDNQLTDVEREREIVVGCL